MATRTFTGQYSSTILILIIKQLSVRQIGRLTVLLINASAYPPIGQYAAAKTDPDPKTNPNPNFSPLLHKQYVSRNPKNVLQMTPCITAENMEKSQHTVPISTKIRLMKALVWPVATCGCESWTLRKNEETRLDAFEMKGLRKIPPVSWTAKKTN